MHQKNGNGTFTSKIGFVLAAVGSAVGMGNIWMFPYRTGQYGGAAFNPTCCLLRCSAMSACPASSPSAA